MNDKIEGYIKALEQNLRDLPEQERKNAILYYEEYLYDAMDSGEEWDCALEKLGTAEKIASMIRVEASINRARNNPGIRSYSGLLKNAFKMVTTPFSILILSLLVIVSFGVVAAFFAAALGLLLSAIAVFLVFVNEITNMPRAFSMEILGAFGIGLLSAGVFMLLSFFFYRFGLWFIRLSVWMIEKMQGKPFQKERRVQSNEEKKKVKKGPVFVFSILCLAGFVLTMVSGLPMRYFQIFNSMKPINVQLQAHTFNMDEVDSLSIVTAHSIIRIKTDTVDEIMFVYGQSDWLDYEIRLEGKTIHFIEKSNGRLPLFHLVSLHESLTELEVILPERYFPQNMKVESTGGHINIEGNSLITQVKTLNGRIEIRPDGLPHVKAASTHGVIYHQGNEVGYAAGNGVQYILSGSSDNTMTVNSTNGDIHIYTH